MYTQVPSVSKTVSQWGALPKEPLKGEKLLQHLKDLQGLSVRDKALHCGYYAITKNKSIRVNVEAFSRAVFVAMNLDSPDPQRRKLNHEVSVQRNGSVVISAPYLRKVGYHPGQRLYIKLEDNRLSLVAADKNGKT